LKKEDTEKMRTIQSYWFIQILHKHPQFEKPKQLSHILELVSGQSPTAQLFGFTFRIFFSWQLS